MTSGADRIVLDTSAYIHLRQGNTNVARIIAEATSVVVPAIVLGELEALYRRGNRLADNRRLLDEFLAEAFVIIANVSHATAHRYAVALAALRNAGTPIPTNDVWIAAVTAETGGRLVTFDSGFTCVEGVLVTCLTP